MRPYVDVRLCFPVDITNTKTSSMQMHTSLSTLNSWVEYCSFYSEYCSFQLINSRNFVVEVYFKGWPDNRSKRQQIKNRKIGTRSKINLYSYWLKLSIICDLNIITTLGPWLNDPWDLIWIYHNRTKELNRTCYTLYNKWALKSDWPIRNLN